MCWKVTDTVAGGGVEALVSRAVLLIQSLLHFQGAPSDSDMFQGRCAPAVVIAVTLGLGCLRVDFPVAEAECAAMYHETFWGLVTGDGKEGRG